jgi:hypothetical protein
MGGLRGDEDEGPEVEELKLQDARVDTRKNQGPFQKRISKH